MSENAIDPKVKIIEAANKIFFKNGVDGTTMSQMADEANIIEKSINIYIGLIMDNPMMSGFLFTEMQQYAR